MSPASSASSHSFRWVVLSFAIFVLNSQSALWAETNLLASPSTPFDEMNYVVGETSEGVGKEPAARRIGEMSQSGRLSAANVLVDLAAASRPILPGIRGICLVPGSGEFPNFLNESGLETALPIFKGTSARVWCSRPHEGNIYGAWKPFIQRMAPATYFIVYPPAVIAVKNAKIKASYISEAENNLPPQTQPQEVAKAAKAAYQQLRALVGDECEIYFEVYNEPQFPKKGAWSPVPFAAYSNDVAHRIREIEPGLKTAVPMHLADKEWNLSLLKGLKPELVDCIVNHNYAFAWIAASKISGDSYYTRVGELARQRIRLREDLAAVREIGGGKWKYAITEWSVHPEGYTGTVPTSTDLAAALYDACMLGYFAEFGVDYAQRFQLVGPTHFGLVPKNDAEIKNPGFQVFKIFSEYFTGDLVPAISDGPKFVWETFPPEGSAIPKLSLEVPFVQVFASKAHNQLCVILVNLSRHSKVAVQLDFKGGTAPKSPWTGEQLTGKADSADINSAAIDYVLQTVSMKPENIELPPNSVTALRAPLN